MKRFKALLIALLTIIVGGFKLPIIPVGAGISNSIIVQEGQYAERLQSDVFFIDDNSGDITVKNSIVRFSATQEKSRFTLRNPVVNQKKKEVSFFFETTFLVEQLPQDTKFGFSFGMDRMRDLFGEDDSSFLYFQNEGENLSVVLSRFQNGEQVLVKNGAQDGFILKKGQEIAISMVVKTNGSAEIFVNGNSFSVEENMVNGAGNVGFGQIGQVGTIVCLSKMSIRGFVSSTPLNTNIFEDFDTGTFNIKEITTFSRAGLLPDSMLAPKNGKLCFNNSPREAWVSTMYDFSNVSLNFELSDLQRVPVYSQSGQLLKTVSSGFSISFGCARADSLAYTTDLYLEIRPVGGTPVSPAKYTEISVMSNRDVLMRITLSDKYNLWAVENEGVDYNFRVSVIDGVLSFGLKQKTEVAFTEILKFDRTFTPFGYVQIACVDGLNSEYGLGEQAETVWAGSFAIDNLAITNRDDGAQLTIVEYVGNLDSIPNDFDYEDSWDDDDLLEDTLG